MIGVVDGHNIEERSIPLSKLEEAINPPQSHVSFVLGDADNVDTTGGQDLDVLTLKDNVWRPKPVPRKITDLTDVSFDTPATGQSLVIENGKVVNKFTSGSSSPRIEFIITGKLIEDLNTGQSKFAISYVGGTLPTGYSIKITMYAANLYTHKVVTSYSISISEDSDYKNNTSPVSYSPVQSDSVSGGQIGIRVEVFSDNENAPIKYGLYSANGMVTYPPNSLNSGVIHAVNSLDIGSIATYLSGYQGVDSASISKGSSWAVATDIYNPHSRPRYSNNPGASIKTIYGKGIGTGIVDLNKGNRLFDFCNTDSPYSRTNWSGGTLHGYIEVLSNAVNKDIDDLIDVDGERMEF